MTVAWFNLCLIRLNFLNLSVAGVDSQRVIAVHKLRFGLVQPASNVPSHLSFNGSASTDLYKCIFLALDLMCDSFLVITTR